MKQAKYVTKHNNMYLHNLIVICTKVSDFKKKPKKKKLAKVGYTANHQC